MRLLLIFCLSFITGCVSHNQQGFTGAWNTDYGPLNLIQEGKNVTGSYYDGKGTLQGVVEGNKLKFSYQEQEQNGEGEFVLSEDGKSFDGKWRTNDWAKWSGARE
jgi:hypothetical protein